MLTSDNTAPELLTKIQSIYPDRSFVVTAPENKFATATETIQQYNDSLIPFVKKYYPKLGVDIEWSSKDGKSFIDGQYRIKGEASASPLFNFY